MSRAHLRTVLAAHFKASPYKTGLLGVLAVALLVLVGRQFLRGPSAAQAALPPTFATIGTAPMPKPIPAPVRPPLPDLPKTPLRDIFKTDWSAYVRVLPVDIVVRQDLEEDPPEEEEPRVLALELTLTAPVNHGQPYAVINGRTVRVGDAIGELVVESISSGVVILADGGNERIELRMD